MTFCRKTRLPILGLVENMSGFVCPHCSVSHWFLSYFVINFTNFLFVLCWLQECSNLFSTGGGESLALETKIPFLGNHAQSTIVKPLLLLILEAPVVETQVTLLRCPLPHCKRFPQSVAESVSLTQVCCHCRSCSPGPQTDQLSGEWTQVLRDTQRKFCLCSTHCSCPISHSQN